MARHTFGGGASDWAFTFNGDGTVSQAAGTVLTFWDSLTGGSQYLAAPLPGGVDDGTGLLDGTGAPISSVTCDGNGEIPDAIQGPDGIYRMAADGSGTGGGPRRWITANNMGDDLNTLFSDVAGIPALEAAPLYVFYDGTAAAYPARPDTTAAVWWVGPVAPTVGGTGGATGSDVWLNTTGATPPGGVTMVTAGDTSITIGGSSAAPTVEMGSLDQAVTLHPPVGPVPMNGQKLTGLANGLASTDGATVGQIPVFTPTAVQTGAYTASPSDFVLVSTSSGAVTVTLPSAPADKTRAGVKMVAQGGTNAVTVAAGGTDKFNVTGGTASLTLLRLFQTVTFQYQASAGLWLVLNTDPALALDSTATDIQPAGTQAAGATGKAADAGHVHDWVFIPTGVKTANYSIQPHDLARFNTSGGAVTGTLPTSPADRTLLGVKIVTPGNLLTINCGAGDSFTSGSGPTSMTMSLPGETVLLQYQASTKAWGMLSHPLGLSGPAASAAFKPSSPAGTTSTTAVMMGLGSTISYTPRSSGVVIVTVTAIVSISAGSAASSTVGARWGTGTAPANATAVTGTTFGPSSDPQVRVSSVTASVGTPYTVTDRLTLTAGTAYWFDLALASTTGNTAQIGNIVAVIQELAA